MKIGLISDTHGYMDDRIAHHLEYCDEIWHAGDIGKSSVIEQLESLAPVKAVYGNIDGTDVRKMTPELLIEERQGLKIAMIHIAGSFGKYNTQTKEIIQAHNPGLLICGHSHILKIKFDSDNKLLYLNPGAAGRSGFHHIRTLCRFDIVEGEIQNMEAIELGSRSSQTVY
ncbi:metallophosphatase family protein [Salibacteraceae bacterium]|nr:metallophosphatase family protein [Salibacteraceae bacterium]